MFSVKKRTASPLQLVLIALGVALLLPAFADVAHAKCDKELKLASLAPPGSDWFKALDKANREIKEKTGGKVCFKIYGGGVMGDESAMIRKVRTGQIDGAVVTSIGLGDIDKQLLVLQLPLVFNSAKKLDCVRDKMTPRFSSILNKKGFVLLGWGDVGFNYLFSNAPIDEPSDMKGVKPWVWDADPITKEVASVVGANPVLLGVPDVLPSLSTGVIDTFLNSPYGAIALQWHSKATHVTDLKLAVVIGGTVLSKKAFDKLTPEERQIVSEISKAKHIELLKKVRGSNSYSKKQLVKKHGYTPVKVKDFKQWQAVAEKTRKNLTGKLFPADLVKEMFKHREGTCK